MPDEPTKDWRDYQYDSFMLRQKEMALKKGQTGSLAGELAVTQFPDKSIASSAIQPGPLVGDFIISSGSLSSRDYGRFGTGWSLNSDGTISGISADAGGSNTQVQYNSSGSLAGSTYFTWVENSVLPTRSVLTVGGSIKNYPTHDLQLETLNSSSGSAKNIYLIGGEGQGTGVGGQIQFQAGDGGSTNGRGGWMLFFAGSGQGAAGGSLEMYAGAGSGTGDAGGHILMEAGSTEGTITSGNLTAGDILLYGGDFRGDNNGTGVTSAGDVFIYGGAARKISGGTKGNYGGLIELGAGDSNWGNGGDFNIWSGKSTGGNGNGGDINITIGLGNGTGSNGNLNILNLPTSSSGLSAGDVWSNGGVLTIVS